jgi:hypothetical protein
MSTLVPKNPGLLFVLGAVLPSMALAVTPTAYLERGKVLETGAQVRAYNVPTTDVYGKVKYYDITITIPIPNDGKPNVPGVITSVLSPAVSTTVFTPGTYQSGGVTCTVVASPFGGITEGTIRCSFTNGSTYTFAAAWYTGTVATNPFKTDLTAAGIAQIPGYSNYAWGKIGQTDGKYWWNCISAVNSIVAARQVNNTLTLYNYGSDSVSNCQVNFVKTAP